MTRYYLAALLVLPLLWARPAPADAPETPDHLPQEMNGLPLVFFEDFSEGAERWTTTDPDAWEVSEVEGRPVFALIKKISDYQPPHRSPHNIARVEDLLLGDFILEARIQSTEPEYGHRDMCIFLGYNDPVHFYYAHIATQADPAANSIFIVDEADRLSIAETRTDGTRWLDDHFHVVRIVRTVESGRIEVYFDNMDTPIMTANDTTFPTGTIGFGSFDDRGMIDTVRIWGERIED